jgi:stearoyl-CoA desaturase (Delta-9 desaturase)
MNNQPQRQPIDWVNSLFLISTPLIALFGTWWYASHHGVTKFEIAHFLVMFMASGMGITMGYHRYYSHRTYECNKILQAYHLIFGAAAVQNSVINWCSDHRYHHRFVDTKEDPYNILRGGLYAHMGWIFYKDTRNQKTRFNNIPDLLKDKWVMLQDKYYLWLVVLTGFVVPTLIGAMVGRPLGGLLWGGIIRIVAVHHTTFLINSAAHLWGAKTYSLTDTARDSWLLGPFTFGEGYHNFHHKFQADYRNGVRWYAIDFGKWAVFLFEKIGWAWKLKRTPAALILKARLEVQMKSVEAKLVQTDAPARMWELVQGRMALGRARLEAAMVQYQLAAVEYRHQKDELAAEARRQWDAKLSEYREQFEDARKRWQDMIKAMNRMSHPTPQQLFTLTAVIDIIRGYHRL